MSDDYSQDTSTTGVLRVGSSATGEIETRGDVDWIKVYLQAGMTYRIDLEGVASRAGSLYDPSLLGIYDARAALLPDTGDDDSGTGFNSRLFLTAGRAGEYYIAVGARGSSEGTYKLLVEEVGADDVPDGEAGLLGIGAPVTGEIELPGDRDRFEVELEAGRTYRIGIDSPIAGRQFDGWLYELSGPGGTPVINAARDDHGRLFIRPSADGEHSIKVGAAGSIRNTGVYTLSVQDVTRVDDHRSGGNSVVTVGGALAGELEKPRDVDWFAVRLEAGELYQVAIQGAGSGAGTLADPLLRGIYTDDGGRPGSRLADSGDDDSGPRQDSLAPVPGAGGRHLPYRRRRRQCRRRQDRDLCGVGQEDTPARRGRRQRRDH